MAARSPCFRIPPPSSCITTYPTAPYWTMPTAIGTVTTTTTAEPVIRPTDLPLAPGSLEGCAAYEMYSVPSLKRIDPKVYNSCGVISSFYGREIYFLVFFSNISSQDYPTPGAPLAVGNCESQG